MIIQPKPSLGPKSDAAPFVSIITVVKDYAEGFRRTADSIIGQKDVDIKSTIEWIVVNGSTKSDAVEKTMAEYQGHISWSQSERDGGIYPAMNIGIDHAHGKYLWFMNAGDTLSDQRTIKTILTAIQQNQECDYIYGDHYHKTSYRSARPFSKNTYLMPTVHQSMLFGRETLGDQRYDTRYKISSDTDMFLKFAQKCRQPLYIQSPLSNFEGGGISQHRYMKGAFESVLIGQRNKTIDIVSNMVIAGKIITVGVLHSLSPELFKTMRKGYDVIMPKAHKKQAESTPVFPIDVPKNA